MEKFRAVENQENRVRRAPLIFIVPAWVFVVATRTKPFQFIRALATNTLPQRAAAGGRPYPRNPPGTEPEGAAPSDRLSKAGQGR